MENSVKDMIRRRKSERSFNGDIQKVDMGIVLAHFDLTMKENKTDGCFVIKDPGFGTDKQMEYIITYEVGH